MFSASKKQSHEFLENLLKTGKPIDELANCILSILIVATVELSQAMINMVNLYLDAPERAKIEKADEVALIAYAREAWRTCQTSSFSSYIELMTTRHAYRYRPALRRRVP